MALIGLKVINVAIYRYKIAVKKDYGEFECPYCKKNIKTTSKNKKQLLAKSLGRKLPRKFR
jgi:hypothetical protein